jgi:RNA polymerase sigma factor (sigma-70 family)
VTNYGRLIAQAVRRVAGSSAANDVDDIQQEVMLALWKRLSDERVIDHPASYLYKAAIREAVRALARVRRRAEESLDLDSSNEPRVDDDVEHTLIWRERQQRLETALNALAPDRARAARAHLSGLSVEEIMQLYGWSYQRARNLIARAVAEIRLALKAQA